jgi:hypothetical protein
VSICPDVTQLTGPLKVEPTTGSPMVDADGNWINADTDEPLVCPS